jgi:hypothetical protein
MSPFGRHRFESDPREPRTRRHESPTVGALRRTSQRRSPSPYLRKEGRNRDVSNSPLTDNDETLRRKYFGPDYANRGQAHVTNQAIRTLDPPTRTVVRDRVSAWGDQRFNENNSQVRTETFNIGEGEALSSGDRNNWYQENGEADGGLPRSRAASVAGSSASLRELKKGRDLMLAKFSLKKAEREEKVMELELAEMDAAVAIEHRSRNSSQAGSSAYSHNPSSASGSPSKSERRSNTGRERSRRRPLRHVLEAPEDLAVIIPLDSLVATSFSSLNESQNDAGANLDVPGSGMRVLDDASPEVTRSRQDAREVCKYHISSGCDGGDRCYFAHPSGATLGRGTAVPQSQTHGNEIPEMLTFHNSSVPQMPAVDLGDSANARNVISVDAPPIVPIVNPSVEYQTDRVTTTSIQTQEVTRRCVTPTEVPPTVLSP